MSAPTQDEVKQAMETIVPRLALKRRQQANQSSQEVKPEAKPPRATHSVPEEASALVPRQRTLEGHTASREQALAIQRRATHEGGPSSGASTSHQRYQNQLMATRPWLQALVQRRPPKMQSSESLPSLTQSAQPAHATSSALVLHSSASGGLQRQQSLGAASVCSHHSQALVRMQSIGSTATSFTRQQSLADSFEGQERSRANSLLAEETRIVALPAGVPATNLVRVATKGRAPMRTVSLPATVDGTGSTGMLTLAIPNEPSQQTLVRRAADSLRRRTLSIAEDPAEDEPEEKEAEVKKAESNSGPASKVPTEEIRLRYTPNWPDVMIEEFQQKGFTPNFIIEGFDKSGLPLDIGWRKGRPEIRVFPTPGAFPLNFKALSLNWTEEDELELMQAMDTSSDPQRVNEALVPKAIKALDFWKAQELFSLHDKKRQGTLDRTTFYELLVGACRAMHETISRQRCDSIFKDIDMDQSGQIDKEEYLGWVFMTNNNYLHAVRSKLESMAPHKVKALFKKIDTNFNNKIDPEEFWTFVSKYSKSQMSREAADELHGYIDADGSGEIDLDEFLNWVHPGREVKLLMGEGDIDGKKNNYSEAPSEKQRSSLPLGFQAASETGYEKPNKPLMETQPGKPVILQFVVGKDFGRSLKAIRKMLRTIFSSRQVDWDIIIDEAALHTNTCMRLEAKVGRGILLWDRDKELPFRQDPFTDPASASEWVKDVLIKCLPDVISAANVRVLKRKAMMLCFECGKNLKGEQIFMVPGDYKTCSKKCFQILNAKVKAAAAEAAAA
eukprot:gb/GFBE01044255.1/.p1 GENE.gb/GFBE01044255.1/~~gb/GFBE01044255.1/.p1  ORF type:complete len:786 (+),score=179.74 gb/GFBE01044255.1/:1-2358(+)